MSDTTHLRRLALAAIASVVLLTSTACGDDASTDAATEEDEAVALVTEVMEEVDLPGEPREIDPTEPPDGELRLGFHCQVEAAGLDVADVVAFPMPTSSLSEVEPGRFEAVDLSLLVFATDDEAAQVQAAYDAPGIEDCYADEFGGPAQVEAVDPLDVDGRSAQGTQLSVTDEGTTTSFTLVEGGILVDVTAFSTDDERARAWASHTLRDVVATIESERG